MRWRGRRREVRWRGRRGDEGEEGGGETTLSPSTGHTYFSAHSNSEKTYVKKSVGVLCVNEGPAFTNFQVHKIHLVLWFCNSSSGIGL